MTARSSVAVPDEARYQSQARDRSTGQYSFEGQWDRLCVCGHELGVHAAEAPHDCMNSDRVNIYGAADPRAFRFQKTDCACLKFRLSRKKASAP